ncbi:MAG: hypothetical protein IJ480_11210 [Clostridia bacterium]|nr:hypothetical protein [Clostridia bacterium]
MNYDENMLCGKYVRQISGLSEGLFPVFQKISGMAAAGCALMHLRSAVDREGSV